MDIKFSKEDEEFRKEISAWLDENIPDFWKSIRLQPFGEIPEEEDIVEFLKKWQATLFEAGWAAITWPREYGGRDANIAQRLILDEEMIKHQAPPTLNMGAISQLGPVLIAAGTDEQKKRFLKPLLRGEELWCQGFSEPGAGSDLASLKTRAEDKGDHFLVNGQKVWTSMPARSADWCYALVRTNRDVPKHKGISYLLIDLKSPGITVRPLKNITGSVEFNEVFLEDVKVPKENVVGGLNQGWQVANLNLEHERLSLGLAFNLYNKKWLEELIIMTRKMKRRGRPLLEDPRIRQKIAQSYIEVEIGRLNGFRSISGILKEGRPGPEASLSRLWSSMVNQRMMELAMEIQGPYAQVDRGSPQSVEDGFWQYAYLRSKAHTIAAGTAEIQKNIIAEKILGLPRS